MAVPGSQKATRPAFSSPAAHEGFAAAYDAMLAKWPVPYEVCELGSEFGRTRVLASGPPDAAPVVLLHGGGATSTVWWNDVAALSAGRRVYAVDHIGDLGHSVSDGRPLRTVDDLLAWLDGVVDGLGLTDVALVGHSYGAWQALTYALHAPARVRRLVLIDPTDCFVGLGWTYRIRALPVLLAPCAARWRAFLAWETGCAALDPDWMDLVVRNGEVRPARPVMPRRPSPERVARDTLPRAEVVVLNDQTHHTLPAHAEGLDDMIAGFLGRD